MNIKKCFVSLVATSALTLFASEKTFQSFVDVVDRCETLWRAGSYDELYKYVDEVERVAPDCASTSILLAWRKEHFGCQYEDESAVLRMITNQIQHVLCEVNPSLMSRIVDMANFADEMACECVEDNEDREYRLINCDPRLNGHKSSAPYVLLNFADLPFLVPDIGKIMPDTQNRLSVKLLQKGRNKAKQRFELGKVVLLDSSVPFAHKKSLLDDYVFELASTSGVKNLIAKFTDGFVQMDGYYVLALLRNSGEGSKQALMDYVSQNDAGEGTDEAMRMAVWALLQFAHDDPEVAEYLRQLPSKIDKRHYKTLEYLKMAIKHLDEGCNRHFLEKYVGGSKNAEESKTLDREPERKN